MPDGVVIRGQGGFYYVNLLDPQRVLECKARSKIKKDLGELMVGDRVSVNVLSEVQGVIEGLFPRRNKLVRPAVSNVDQVLTVFSMNSPDPIPLFMDKLLISVMSMGLAPVIVFTKSDLATPGSMDLADDYKRAGFRVHMTSTKLGTGFDDLQKSLSRLVSVLAGPSGVGKSALMNVLQSSSVLLTGAISDKIKRGRHTTRHASLLPVEGGGWVADTPGFSVLDLTMIKKADLPGYYQEFEEYSCNCRFMGCMHRAEPTCGVKDAVDKGLISALRYGNYLTLLSEMEALPPEWARKSGI